MEHQAFQYTWNTKPLLMSPKETQESYTKIGNLIALGFLLLPELIMYILLRATNFPHRINLYFLLMVLVPVVFVFASGNANAYATIFHDQWQRFSWRTALAAFGTLIAGFILQNIVFTLDIHHAEWNVWKDAGYVWKDFFGNIVFLCVNPLMEEMFWRVFMHRELATRWFPCKSQSDEQLLSLTTGKPVLPRLSTFGILLISAAFSLWHYVPIVIYDLPIYKHAGMTYHMALGMLAWLFVFGVIAMHVRQRFGILATWAIHLGVDIADIMMYTWAMMKISGNSSSTAQIFKSWE